MTNQTPAVNQFYSVKELATRLGVSLSTIHRYANEGKLHRVKLGRTTRFSESDVLAFLSQPNA